MPRIAAAIGVFLAIAAFTFINIKSYPTVWEMVGASPWFNRQAESSPSSIPAQTEQIAETKAAETPAPAAELKSLSGSKTLLPAESSTQEISPLQSQTAGATPYQGLNVGPIIVSQPPKGSVAGENSPPSKSATDTATQSTTENTATELPTPAGSTWPAEMSPRMKYAAKPSLLETYQNWNPERPLVPVDSPPETPKADDKKQDKSEEETPKAAVPAAQNKDSKDPDAPIVHRLPPVDAKDRPILMSISPDGPIPIYPNTGK